MGGGAMNAVTNFQAVKTMTSREIAALTGKEHFHVMRDIRAILIELHGEIGLSKFGSSYVNEQNKSQPMFVLPKDETMTLITGYSIPLRHAVMKRWDDLEVRAATPATPPLPGPVADKVAAMMLVGDFLARVPGVKPGMAAACALTLIQQATGESMEAARLLLPAPEVRCSLNATRLAELMGITGPKAGSNCPAAQVNRQLVIAGFQKKNERGDWEPTESGKQYGEVVPYQKNGHPGYQLLWSKDVIAALEAADI